ncbi:MAG: sugar fermentation stimulation protein [Eubacterium sp.]|nr:sugar fermentation stimulation protein [Eubacterium sp.]
MKKDYRKVIRLISVIVLLIAIFILFVRRGSIPKFWEQAQETVQPVDVSQVPDEAEGERETGAAEADETSAEEAPSADTSLPTEEKADTTEDDNQPETENVPEQLQEAENVEAQPEEELSQEIEASQENELRLQQYLADDPRTPTEAKGIFVTGAVAGTQSMMPELVKLVEDTSLNAMVIDIKNDAGEITYKMGLPLTEEIGAEVRYVADMPKLIQELKEKDIYLIARIVAFKDPILAEQKPEYAVKNADGSVFHDNNDLAWVNPYNENVWDYLIEVSKQAAELGFDEIQYDYIRFSTAKGIAEADFGTEAAGKTKQDAINGFLKKAYETLAPMGVYVSTDVFGTIICNPTDGKLIGQDYVEMAKNCDYICPMVYPSHYVNNAYGIAIPDAKPYELIYAAVKDGEDLLQEARDKEENVHIAKQRPWLQAFTASWVKGYIPYRGNELQKQVQGAKDAGVSEWLLWNASNNYDKVKSGL